MISEAVEEVLNLVQNATQTFKTMIGAENDPLAQGELRCFRISPMHTHHKLTTNVKKKQNPIHHKPKKQMKMVRETNRKTGVFFGLASKIHYHCYLLVTDCQKECRSVMR